MYMMDGVPFWFPLTSLRIILTSRQLAFYPSSTPKRSSSDRRLGDNGADVVAVESCLGRRRCRNGRPTIAGWYQKEKYFF